MQIKKIVVRKITIPFRFGYGHAKANHKGVSIIICTAYDNNSRKGFGESVPRTYVTGETCETAIHSIKQIVPRLIKNDYIISFKFA